MCVRKKESKVEVNLVNSFKSVFEVVHFNCGHTRLNLNVSSSWWWFSVFFVVERISAVAILERESVLQWASMQIQRGAAAAVVAPSNQLAATMTKTTAEGRFSIVIIYLHLCARSLIWIGLCYFVRACCACRGTLILWIDLATLDFLAPHRELPRPPQSAMQIQLTRPLSSSIRLGAVVHVCCSQNQWQQVQDYWE